MILAIDVAGLSKTYRIPNIPKQATVKDMVVRRVRNTDGVGLVDALSDVTFSVEQGQALGIVGRNGSGKTTLLRVLAGVCRADSGKIHIAGAVAVLTALGVGFHPDLTGRENAWIGLLALGLSRADAGARMGEVIDFSELAEFIDLPMHTYSTGMYMRLAFSISICVRPNVLLLDEVLAVGDQAFGEKCRAHIARFRRSGSTMAIATHDPHVVSEWCDTALLLHEGRVAAFGPPARVLAAYGDLLVAERRRDAC